MDPVGQHNLAADEIGQIFEHLFKRCPEAEIKRRRRVDLNLVFGVGCEIEAGDGRRVGMEEIFARRKKRRLDVVRRVGFKLFLFVVALGFRSDPQHLARDLHRVDVLADPNVAFAPAQIKLAEGFARTVNGFVLCRVYAQIQPVIDGKPHRRHPDPFAAVLRFNFQLALVEHQQHAVVGRLHIHHKQRPAADHFFLEHKAAAAHFVVGVDIGNLGHRSALGNRKNRFAVPQHAELLVFECK